MNQRVIIFGLDGATYTVLDDLVQRGVMPFLGGLFERQSRSLLMSTVPPLTPPAWTSLVTGRTPGHHGILNFLQYESADSQYVRVVTAREVCCETLWSMANRHGRRAGCLNFVAHNPAPKVDGYIVPGWVAWRWVKNQSHPKDLVARLQHAILGFDVKELAMNFSEEEKAVAGTFNEEYEPWIDLHIKRERQWFNILKYQYAKDPTDLTAVVFDGVDKLQHLCWEFLDPNLEPADPSPAFLKVRERCWDYFRQIDGFLRDTVAMAGRDAHIFIASDHGFTGSHEILYINTWLAEQGYLTWNEQTPVRGDDSLEVRGERPYHLHAFNMEKTRAYARSASSNGIHIAVKGVRGEHGIEPGQYERFRAELIDRLMTECIDPATGEPLITKLWTKEEAFSGPKESMAPDITVETRDFGNFSVLRSDVVLKPRQGVMGFHHPEGVFIALGPGIREGGAFLDPLQIIDVAPTVLYAMGLPIPEELQGRVATEFFTPKYVSAHAIQTETPRTPDAVSEESDAELEQEDDPQILMRLKALGYIE